MNEQIDIWRLTLDIWTDGGVLMIPLALLAFVIYTSVLSLMFQLMVRQFDKKDPNLIGHWIDRPDEGRGELGDIIRYLSWNSGTFDALHASLLEVRNDYLPSFDRRIRFCMILVSAAPLTGLLGTVVGMLKTFNGIAISTGSGTAGLVAGGIAEALITTQTGLVIAIPGYVFISQVKNRRGALDLFFRQLENAFVRKLIRNQ